MCVAVAAAVVILLLCVILRRRAGEVTGWRWPAALDANGKRKPRADMRDSPKDTLGDDSVEPTTATARGQLLGLVLRARRGRPRNTESPWGTVGWTKHSGTCCGPASATYNRMVGKLYKAGDKNADGSKDGLVTRGVQRRVGE